MPDRKCAQVDRLLARGEPLGAEAGLHVEHCRRCSRMLGSIGPLPDLEALGDESAPPALRDQVSDLLASAAREEVPRNRRRAFVAAGVSLVAVAGTGAALWRTRAPVRRAEALLDEMFMDHLKYREATRDLHVRSSKPGVIQRWLRDELAIAARVVHLENANPLGARHCWLGDQEAGLIFYRLHDDGPDLASLYVMSAPDADFSHMRPLLRTVGKRVCRRHHLGLSAAIWEERGLTYSLVSELDDDRLARILDDA